MKRKTVIIKKYGNRRLYDATHSRYINHFPYLGTPLNGFNTPK